MEEVELPASQELEEMTLKPSNFKLMCKELVLATCMYLPPLCEYRVAVGGMRQKWSIRFFWEVVRYHGPSRSIIRNRGPVSVQQLWTELMKFLDKDAMRSPPHHQQANGQAERTNKTLKQVLRTLSLTREAAKWPS